MTDKVQKIRKEIESYKSAAEHFLKYKDNLEHWRIQKDLCDKFLYFIDSLQEEPKFKTGDRIKPIDSCLGYPRIIEEVYDGWYVTDQGTLDFEFEDNWELVEQKSAWTQEDCSKVQRICKYLNEAKKYYADITEVRECIDWLKSLKDRVQPKQEWGEEDEKMKDAIYSCVDLHYDGLAKTSLLIWLKSLRPQNTWKPSDEQMERLKGAINSLPHQEVLYSLYQDLKKLREK